MKQYLRWNPETGRITGELNHGQRDENQERRNEEANEVLERKKNDENGQKRRHEDVKK